LRIAWKCQFNRKVRAAPAENAGCESRSPLQSGGYYARIGVRGKLIWKTPEEQPDFSKSASLEIAAPMAPSAMRRKFREA
jgi:hypothetical protein